MINFEEELKKFHPSLEVEEAEDAIYSHDMTDMMDILKEVLKESKDNDQQRNIIRKAWKWAEWSKHEMLSLRCCTIEK